MLIANALLAHEHGSLGDSSRSAHFLREVERLREDGASVWTRAIAEKLTNHSKSPPRAEAR